MRCKQCGGDTDILGAHRIPSYCSNACRQKAYRQRNTIPSELRKRDRWVTWEPRWSPSGLTKVPLMLNGRFASSTNPTTWTSYAAVRQLPRKGFVLGSGIGCIDLDHCLVKGMPSLACRAMLDRLPGTYIEVSPSGDGLHIWGLLPEGPGRRYVADDGLSIERYSVGRYMTVTGRTFEGSVPTLADLTGV